MHKPRTSKAAVRTRCK